VRTRPREPLPSTLILLVTMVVSLEVVDGFSFRLVSGVCFVSFCLVPGTACALSGSVVSRYVLVAVADELNLLSA
jgi:hypothetical protein